MPAHATADPRQRKRTQPFPGQYECPGRHHQRRQAARERIDLAQVAEAIGGEEEGVVADVKNRGGHEVRPARAGRERQRQHERDAEQKSDRVDRAEGDESIVVALDQRVPRRVRKRRDQDKPGDLEGHRSIPAGERRYRAGLSAGRLRAPFGSA